MNYFDLHCDTAFECFKRHLPFNNNELSITQTDAMYFEKWVQTFAIWIEDTTENPFLLYKNILNDIKAKLKNSPNNLIPIFAVEGGAVLENSIERIDILKQGGIKMLTLTWNGENAIAGGVKSEKGLTDFGKEAISELNRLSIATDLSHLNKKSFYKAVEIAEFPIATHSNCYEIQGNPRNLTLDQISLIAEKNGIIGLNLYPPFLGKDVFEGIYKNIDYLCTEGYENHIAIGTDFDGGEMDVRLNKASKIPKLYAFLTEKGLEKALLDKIFYKNAYNFIAKL